LSVAPQNGFSDSVTVTLQGVPQGVTVSPSSPFVLTAGQTRSLAFTVPAMAPVGIASITVLATSGALSHGAQLTLTTRAQPAVRTYQDGSVLYLESSSGSDTARIGLETKWGGSIVEVSLNGVNFVNAHDTGREVVDGAVDGTASYGATRPDIPAVFPHAPASVGFSYPLDTTKYPNAAHTLNVRVTDSSGNVVVFADVPVTVSN
jgi:hypothetical protein